MPASPFAAGLAAGMVLITFFYTAMTAWQDMKILYPDLQVREDLLTARVRHFFVRPVPPEVPVPRSWVAGLYDDTR